MADEKVSGEKRRREMKMEICGAVAGRGDAVKFVEIPR